MRSLIKSFIFLFLPFAISAQEITIIPQPASLKRGAGYFNLGKNTALVVQDDGDLPAAGFFNNYLQEFYGFSLPVSKTPVKNAIRFYTKKFIKAPDKDGYSFEATSAGISISGDTYAGTFYGMQTLVQLLPLNRSVVLKIPVVSVQDAPRFNYRGMHLDVGRHFFPVSFVKKYIDYLALHKMNYFHWHLTDDQGWRIEIKKYPRLTTVGGWRNGTIIGRYPGTGNDGLRYGGFYTQEEIKEVVAYAAQRHITVVPEIEMPGHASAAIAAYPELSCFSEEPTKNYYPKDCAWAGDSTGKQVQQTWGVFDDVFCAGKENTFQFLQDVLDEVLPLFPSRMIHVGGDECPKANWKKCPLCQQRMKENGLKDEHELQSYFIQRMEKYLNGKGRKLIGWDEILEGGLAPNAAVMSWRGESGGIAAAKQHHEVVMTPTDYAYFDYSQTTNEDSVTIGGFVSLEKVYNYNPIPAALDSAEGKYVLGAQANLWTEYITNPRKVEYMIFPRLTALSEVLWSAPQKKNWNAFEKRMQVQFNRYNLWKANYSRAFFDLRSSILPAPGNKGVLWKLETKQSSAQIRYKKHIAGASFVPAPAEGVLYKTVVPITSSTAITGWSVIDKMVKGNGISQEFKFNKATGKKITLATQPAGKYASDGAFTLVNGVQNEKGMSRSREFLGFEGTDCDATIDFGQITSINEVIAHTLEQRGSWIYYPQGMEVFTSADGKQFSSIGSANIITDQKTLKLELASPVKARYLRVWVKNKGIIPTGLPGADHKAWLFVDEIEVN
ncbi:MAG TPA: family 20 glycosylhydrolase [Chitinophagaceae bacterium]|nr:family 20 glycosylhydrolase [Chitinophagaceae bacterium]